jgi:hypothetical protein
MIIILGGFVVLAGCLGLARLAGGNSAARTGVAVRIFTVVWFLIAAANMVMGVARAGYSFADELPIFLLIFLLPVAVAVLIKRRFS